MQHPEISKRLTCLAIIISCFFVCYAQEIKPQQYREDYEYFWKTLKEEYAYWDKKHIDWNKVHELYIPTVDTISSKKEFVSFLEEVFYELYDHHASLSMNTMESQRMVPSGSDIWAEFINGRAVIKEVRLNYGASKKGMRAGMEIVGFNDVDIETAIQPFMPRSLQVADTEARNFALRVLLAGSHAGSRKITVKEAKRTIDFFPDDPVSLLEESSYNGDIESKIFKGNTGYIRINNRLGDNGLIPLFDSVMATLKNTRALILDLRETPGGGNTTVARAILGSFISKEGFYQKHEISAEERIFGIKRSWMELVTPRKYVYTKPLVVLVNHWTGSVGEGITIGFDAFKRARIIGTPMAGLNGAVYSFTMPHTGIGFNFPCEKLFHVNGLPREKFKPALVVDLTIQKTGQDMILDAAMKSLGMHNY